MVTTNISITGLESYQPAVDYRRSGKIGILSGKNFAWDASGVFSSGASRLVSGTHSLGLSPAIAQSLDLETIMHVAVDDTIWQLNPTSAGSPIGTWEEVTELDRLVFPDSDDVPYNFRKWTTAYLGYEPYAAAYNYGVFRVNAALPLPTYTRLTSVLVPGFPTDDTPVIAIGETNGRMIYLTELTVYWSGANAPEDLAPALGGAGFQIIAEKIGGTPFAVTPVSMGAIVWTTAGALVMEFIGGDNVFRFWQLSTQALPISSFAITRMPDDDYVLMTRLGLFMFNNMSQPQPITPLFDEFLREYLRNKPNELGHVWYSITDNRLYCSMRNSKQAFVETFTLDIMLDRWGVFSEPHIGFFEYGVSRGQLAYATPKGVASFLLSSIDGRKNKEDVGNPGHYTGLSSEIMIGWIRAENLIQHADVVQELQEININRLQPFGEIQVSYEDEGFMRDPVFVTTDDGHMADPAFVVIDEGYMIQVISPFKYQLQVWSDLFTTEQDGDDLVVFNPELARKNRASDLWTCQVPALYYRLRFIANADDEFFRINSMDMTVNYSGNLS